MSSLNFLSPFGGVNKAHPPTMLDSYALVIQGPEDINDRVQYPIPVDPSVPFKLPKGRVFSLSQNTGTLDFAAAAVPGIPEDDELPVVLMLIGSETDDTDVVGSTYNRYPADWNGTYIDFRDEYNAPFTSMHSGYIVETSEYHPDDALLLTLKTPVTSPYDVTDPTLAGTIRPGHVYVDHVFGVIIQPPKPAGINRNINTVLIQTHVIPRLTKAAVETILT